MIMVDLTKSIGMRLKAARKAAGYRSATAFAGKRDIPMSTYSQHECGKRSINVESLVYYAEQLGIQAGWLLSGQGEPFQSTIQDVAKKNECVHKTLGNQSGPINVQDSKESQLGPIVEPIATVDMHLFKEILVRLLVLHSEEHVEISDKELIEFAIEVYNGIINTSASLVDKIAMIDLSIASLKRGVTKQEVLVKKQKSA